MTMKAYRYLLLVPLLAVSCERKPLDPDILGKPAFHVTAEVSSDARDRASSIIFLLKEGNATSTYTAAVMIDGKDIFPGPQRLDFSGESVARIYLPAILPGHREAVATVSDGLSEETIALSFEEPVRFPTVDMSLDYDAEEGTYSLSVTGNQYGLHIHAESLLRITGKATYFAGSSSDWTYEDPGTFRRTDTKTVSAEAAVDCDGEGLFRLADRDAKAGELTSSYMLSAIWRGGGGSEDFYWYVTGYEPVYYRITGEEFSVRFDIETVPGVTPVLRNNISGCRVSGLQATDR